MKRLQPPGKATKDEIKAFLDDATFKESPQRVQLFREWEINRLYIRSKQWLEPAIGSGLVGGGGSYQSPFLQPIMDGDDLQPRPVHNEILPIVQNELARMLATGTKVRVVPTESGPSVKKAAKLAEDVIRAQDELIGFEQLRTQFVRNQIVYGLGIYLSEQTTDYSTVLRDPKQVMGCVNCRWVASLPDAEVGIDEIPLIVGPSAFRAASHGARPVNFREMSGMGVISQLGLDEQPQAEMSHCPECGGSLLTRFAGPDDGDVDYNGSNLYQTIPRQDVGIRVISPRDFFPAASGRLDPDRQIRRFATEEIVSLDFIAQFYEDGYKVKTEGDQMEIRRWHPQGYEDGTYIVDTNQRELEGHTVLRRYVRLPYFEIDPETGKRSFMDRGRFIVMAGSSANSVVLIDDDLMIRKEDSDELVPRCAIHWAPWDAEDQTCFSPGLVTHLLSPQDNLNTAFAQAIETRHDFANPKMMLRPGQNIEYIGQSYGNYANSLWRWQGGTEPPIVQDGHQLPEQWRYEVAEYKETMQRVAMARDVEMGNAPKGVTAATALQLLAEKASVGRGPRQAATRDAIKSLTRHRLRLMEAIFTEPRDFVAASRGDRPAIKAFMGTQLMGQCDVEVAIEPFVESPTLRREAAKEAVQGQILTLKTSGDRRRYMDLLGVPPDLAPADSYQIEQADREWSAFVRRRDENGRSVLSFGEQPIVKRDYDDHIVHPDSHLATLMSWEGEELRRNWGPIQVAIDGWRDEWDRLVTAEADLKANPIGDAPPPLERDNIGLVNAHQLEAQTALFKARQAMAQTLAAMPELPELRIYDLFLRRCEGGSKPLRLEDADKALLRILAHIEGHRHEQRIIEARAQAAQAMMQASPAQSLQKAAPRA